MMGRQLIPVDFRLPVSSRTSAGHVEFTRYEAVGVEQRVRFEFKRHHGFGTWIRLIIREPEMAYIKTSG